MGQHNSFGKDIDLLSEAYGQILGGAHMMQGTGVAGQAAQHMASEDGEDKTGGKSDHDLLASVEKKHTAGKALLDKARSELDQNESLSKHTRDSLARDEYGYGGEDAEAAASYPTFHKSEKKKSDVYDPWDDVVDDDEDAEDEDTDEADAGPEAKRRKDEDEKAAKQGFTGKPATPAH
tara:strand:+ start:45 stop:578 length:534 start_codon:yes stop_codon:yes gene_type:complete